MTRNKRPYGDKTPRKQRRKSVELTPQEAAQLEQQRARNRQRYERPEVKFESKGPAGRKVLTITSADKQNPELHGAAMYEALGTRSLPFINDTMSNINGVLAKDRLPSEQRYSAAVAILAAVEPQNELEATLGSQIVAANEAAFRSLRGMISSDVADHHKMYGDLANKFMRTSAALVEALAKLRRGGEQVVKHVYVQEGGQALIAGTINAGGRGNNGSIEQPYGASAISTGATLSGQDTTRVGVPIPGNAQRPL